MLYFEHELMGVPFFFEWGDLQITSKDGVPVGGDFEGWVLDDGDYTELVNAINEVASSVSDELVLLNSRINNLLYDPIPDTSAMDGRRLYIHQFVEVFSTDQIDGLEQRLSFFTNALSEKLSNIFASELTGITIDKSDPINPVIIANKPLWEEVREKPDQFNPSPHTHTKAEITDLGESGGGASTWDELSGKPTSFPPSLHGHDWEDISGKPASFPPSLHGHDWEDISGKPASFPPSLHGHDWEDISGKPTSFPASPHGHSQGEISGLLDTLNNLQSQITALGSGSGGTSIDAIKAFAGWFADHWVTRTTTDKQWISVSWASFLKLFVAVANGGTGSIIMTSADGGVTWVERTHATVYYLTSVCSSTERGIIVAVGTTYGGGTTPVVYSADGASWIQPSTFPNVNANLTSVCWASIRGIFCAVGSLSSANVIFTSEDGINWLQKTAPTGTGLSKVCFSPKRNEFCAIMASGVTILSPDGNTWVNGGTIPTVNSLTGLCWSEEHELYVATGANGTTGYIFTSPDGINWTQRLVTPNTPWQNVCVAEEIGLFCAVSPIAISGARRVVTSPDGINWTLRSATANNQTYDVTWAKDLGMFCIVCNSGSANRVWTTRTGLGAGHL
ncbi:hypothetical protein [Leptospira harrisiae]|uniref:hypothetical protein n=1 Tax=Leptospira harrisiae TaxID=2023189 RepID=UPI000C2B09A1|nr:hypothetical protein [Leptospira harrisiae]PKA08663.1 hypothetical protein CH366_02505 [Leptospira harrisiae]